MSDSIIFTKDASKQCNDMLLENNRVKGEKALKEAIAFILVTTDEKNGSVTVSGNSEEVVEMMEGLVNSLLDASKIARSNFKES